MLFQVATELASQQHWQVCHFCHRFIFQRSNYDVNHYWFSIITSHFSASVFWKIKNYPKIISCHVGSKWKFRSSSPFYPILSSDIELGLEQNSLPPPVPTCMSGLGDTNYYYWNLHAQCQFWSQWVQACSFHVFMCWCDIETWKNYISVAKRE